jgi:hypothetical protein
MKFKKIVGFGDSWVWGDELLDPLLETHPQAHPVLVENTAYRESNCFLGLIGKHYGVPTENFGIPGGSLQSTIWTLLWWLDHEPNPEECLVLVGLTNSHRFTHYNPNHEVADNDAPWHRFVHSPWADSGSVSSDFAHLIKQQTVLTDCPLWRQLNYQQTVLTIDGIAARRNLNLVQYHIAPGERLLTNVPTLIWPNQSLMYWFVQELQHAHGRKYIKANGHPNEIGHELIAQRLINHLDSCIIKG